MILQSCFSQRLNQRISSRATDNFFNTTGSKADNGQTLFDRQFNGYTTLILPLRISQPHQDCVEMAQHRFARRIDERVAAADDAAIRF
jgi:hypothetical protein